MTLALRTSVHIGAPAERVFDLLCSPERLPEWNVSVESARRAVVGAPVELGARAIVVGRLLGQRLESETEVITFDAPRVLATRAVRGPRLVTCFTIEPGPEGTMLDVAVSGDVPGGALGERLAEGFLRRELATSLHRLRHLCERDWPDPGTRPVS